MGRLKRKKADIKPEVKLERAGAILVSREDIMQYDFEHVVEVLNQCCHSHKIRLVDEEDECPEYTICVNHFDAYCEKL